MYINENLLFFYHDKNRSKKKHVCVLRMTIYVLAAFE